MRSSSGHSALLAPPRVPIVLLALAGAVTCLAIVTLVSVSDELGIRTSSHYWRTFPGWGAFLGLVLVLLYCAVTARIDGIGGQIRLVNLFTVVKIDVCDVLRVDSTNGVIVRMHSGDSIESTAYGSSLLQVLFRSNTYARAATRVEGWAREACQNVGTSHRKTQLHSTHVVTRVPRRLRRAWIPGIFLSLLLSEFYGALLWAMGPWLYQYVK